MHKNQENEIFIFFNFSLYAYLFAAKPDRILEYKIECDETGKPFKVYRSQWDKMFSVETNTILISTHETLYEALKTILFELRDIELKSNLYKRSETAPKVECYIPLLAKLENNIMEGDTTSKNIFGNHLKYDDQKIVKETLNTHGFRFLKDGSNQIAVDENRAILFEKYVAEELNV